MSLGVVSGLFFCVLAFIRMSYKTMLISVGVMMRKKMILVDDVDSRVFLCEMIGSMWKELSKEK